MLRYLPHPRMPAYASPGTELKARDLQAYLGRIGEGLTHLGLEPPRVKLFLLNEADWRARLRLPYGFPAAKKGEVFAPATLPERLAFRVLEAFTEAGVGPPIPLTEAFDLIAGHEYGHAVALALGKREKSWRANERMAHCLWLAGLLGDPRLARIEAWARALSKLPAPEGRPRRLTEELGAQGRLIIGCLEELFARGPLAVLKEVLS